PFDPRALHDRRFAFLVKESDLGIDVNDDGDFQDSTPFTFDARTGTTLQSGHVAESAPQLGEHHLVFLGQEPGTAAGGATTLFVQALRTGLVRDLGILTDDFRLEDERIIAAVREDWTGKDLNGDHDALDRVLAVHDLRTGRTTNTGVAFSRPLLSPES